jgi:glycosyltransferase involved in cell wall biosynthesis
MPALHQKVLHVLLFNNTPTSKNPLLVEKLEKHGFIYNFYSLETAQTFAILRRGLLMRTKLENYEYIITSEYFTSFAVNLRLLLTSAKTKHVVIGLNQSRRLLKTNVRIFDRLINRIFRRADLIIVHSRREAVLFSKFHDIPENRFHFSLWGYDLPSFSASRFSAWPKPYVCLVGRNNRDIETFIKAVTGTDVDGIIIIPSYQSGPAGPLPPNVHVYRDLPQNETLDCIKNAVANIVLVKDNDRGAGHITIVTAMFAGTPQIVSDVDVIKDYVVDGVSAITVPLRAVEAVRSGINKIINDPSNAARLSENAKRYAHSWLTNDSATERIMSALDKLSNGEKIPLVDSAWFDAYTRFSKKAPV